MGCGYSEDRYPGGETGSVQIYPLDSALRHLGGYGGLSIIRVVVDELRMPGDVRIEVVLIAHAGDIAGIVAVQPHLVARFLHRIIKSCHIRRFWARASPPTAWHPAADVIVIAPRLKRISHRNSPG